MIKYSSKFVIQFFHCLNRFVYKSKNKYLRKKILLKCFHFSPKTP